MKKQLYKIDKNDWCVSVRSGKDTAYQYFFTKKEAMKYMKSFHKPGYTVKIQVFKISYEFVDAWVV